jgi:hypothetical protein
LSFGLRRILLVAGKRRGRTSKVESDEEVVIENYRIERGNRSKKVMKIQL